MVPAGAALTYVPFPDLGPEGGPGPFSLADPDRTRQLLTDARFEDVDVREITEQTLLGENARDATEFLDGTSMARLLFEDVDAETEQKAIDAVRGLLEAHEQPDGVWLGSAAWLVTATRP
jgi:hypothetical protein